MSEAEIRKVRPSTTSRFSKKQAEARHRLFIAREREQQQFRECLENEDSPRIFFVHGAGGIGKSSLLHAYARIAAETGTYYRKLDARTLDAPPAQVAETIYAALNGCDERSICVLAIDNLDRISALDAWLRNELVPNLPSNVVLVLAGRDRPRSQCAAEPGLNELIIAQELTALDSGESAEYLDRRNVAVELRKEILTFARGYPLALALCTDLAGRVSSDAFRATSPEVISTLMKWLMENIRDPRKQRAIATAATVRRVTIPMLSAVLGSNATDEFDWLAEQQFMEQQPDGLVMHDLVRDVVVRDLRARDVDEHHGVIERATGYLLSNLDDASMAQARAAINDTIYSLRCEPHVQRHFLFDDRRYFIDAAADRELPDLIDEVSRLEGEPSRRWFQHWARTQMNGLVVVRDSEEAAVGIALSLAFDRNDIAMGSEDPVVTAFFEYLKSHAPLREAERAILLRFMMAHDTHQERTAVWAQLAILSNAAMFEPNAAFVAFVAELSHDWGGLSENADGNFLEGTEYETGGRQFALIGHDARAEPPVAWARNCTARILQQGASPRLKPIVARILDRESFDAAVLDLLRHHSDDESVRANPLRHSAMLHRHTGRTRCRISDLRDFLHTLVSQLDDGKAGNTTAQTLRLAYFEPEPKLVAAADRVHVSERTFRRRLREAEHALQSAMWQRETGSA